MRAIPYAPGATAINNSFGGAYCFATLHYGSFIFFMILLFTWLNFNNFSILIKFFTPVFQFNIVIFFLYCSFILIEWQ